MSQRTMRKHGSARQQAASISRARVSAGRCALPSAHTVPASRGRIRIVAFKEDESPIPNATGTQQKKTTATVGRPAILSGGYAAYAKGEALKPFTHDLPAELKPGEIDIKVTHNGVCHSDLHCINDDWFISKFPFIPGHEVVGEVMAVGSQVSGLRPGSRVGVGWIKDSCRRCAPCLRGEENLCYAGYTGTIVAGNHGGFQAVLRVPADFAYHIPDTLPSADAAPLLCAGITVFSPLKKYMSRPGMHVCVLGVGGLGHLAIQFGNVMGGIVTAIDKDSDKMEEAHSLGAQDFDVFDDQVALRSKSKFDVILNCASARLPSQPLLDMLRNDGVLVQIGIPGNKAEMSLPITDLVFGQKKVVGSIVGGRSDMQTMLELAANKNVRPMIEVMPSNKVNEALQRMQSGKARYRVVLDMSMNPDPNLIVRT